LAASSALASSPEGTTFQATELSTLTLGSTSGTQGAMIELQDTGLVIDNIAGSTYVHQNPDGTQTTNTGYAALLSAVYDGSFTTAEGYPTNPTQGIVSVNSINGNADAKYFGIAFANANSLGLQTTFGGIPLNNATTGNQYVVRDDYLGDANMAGVVTVSDFDLWLQGITGKQPAAWNTGDFNHGDGMTEAVTVSDFDLWVNAIAANLPALGDSSAGPVVSAGSVAAVPEPGTFALLLAGATSCVVVGVRRFRKSTKKSTFTLFQASRGFSSMKKCLIVVAAIAALAFANVVRAADLMDYSLVPDAVYADSNFDAFTGTATISQNASTGQWSVVLPKGTTSAYVTMAILATINNSTSGPISGDGIAQAGVVFDGSSKGMGSDTFWSPAGSETASVNSGNMTNANNNNPTTAAGGYWVNNWATPVQGYGILNAKGTAVAAIAQWPVNFNQSGASGGTAISNLQIGNTGILSATDKSYFVAITGTAAPTVPSNSRLVNYNSDGTQGTVSPTNSTAIQPVTNPYFIQGASGFNSTSAVFCLGELDYMFSNGTNGGTASLGAQPANLSTVNGGESASFMYNGTQTIAKYETTTSGASGTVGAGPNVQISILGGSVQTTVAGVTDVTVPSITGPVIATALPLPTVTGTLTNTTTASGSNVNDAVNWSVAATSANGGTLTPTSLTGSALATGGTAPLSYTYTAPANFFGNDTIKLTPSGTNATIGGSAGSDTGATSTTVNVIGVATYGTKLTSASISQGGSFAGLQTQLSNTSSLPTGIGATAAMLLAGTASTATNVTMTWRDPTAGEQAGQYGHPLFSDVVNLGGTGTSPYVLQMSFGSAGILAHTSFTSVAQAAAAGQIYIGYNTGATGGTGTPAWSNYGNNGIPSSTATNGTPYLGTYASFAAAVNGGPITATNLGNFVGDWGVNPANDTAWAIVAGGTTGEFAVVPEPGTLALLAAGALSLAIAYRRRKAAKA
jgi:hypothetical protein